LKPAHLEITFKPGAWVTPQAIVQRIKDTGYAAREKEVRLTLTGALSEKNGTPVLSVSGTKAPVTVALAANEKQKDAWAAVAERLKSGESGPVEVEGFWQKPDKKAPKDAPMILRVTRAAPVKPPSGGG
jgi:hypothetical protein